MISEIERLRAAYTERVETRRAAMESELRRLTSEWNALVAATRPTDEGGRPQAYWDLTDEGVRARLDDQHYSGKYTGPVPVAPAFTGWDPEAWNQITWPGGTQTGPGGGPITGSITYSGGEVVVKVEDGGWKDYNGRGVVQQYRLTGWSGTVYETRLTNERSGGLFSGLSSVVSNVGNAIATVGTAVADTAVPAMQEGLDFVNQIPGVNSALATVTGGASIILSGDPRAGAEQFAVDMAIGAAVGGAAGVAAGTITAGVATSGVALVGSGTAAAMKGAEELGIIDSPDSGPSSHEEVPPIIEDPSAAGAASSNDSAPLLIAGAALVILFVLAS